MNISVEQGEDAIFTCHTKNLGKDLHQTIIYRPTDRCLPMSTLLLDLLDEQGRNRQYTRSKMDKRERERKNMTQKEDTKR